MKLSFLLAMSFLLPKASGLPGCSGSCLECRHLRCPHEMSERGLGSFGREAGGNKTPLKERSCSRPDSAPKRVTTAAWRGWNGSGAKRPLHTQLRKSHKEERCQRHNFSGLFYCFLQLMAPKVPVRELSVLHPLQLAHRSSYGLLHSVGAHSLPCSLQLLLAEPCPLGDDCPGALQHLQGQRVHEGRALEKAVQRNLGMELGVWGLHQLMY